MKRPARNAWALVAPVALLCGALGLGHFVGTEPKRAAPVQRQSIDTAATQPAPVFAASGRLSRVENNTLVVVDGEGDHTLAVDSQTLLGRGVGHVFVQDHDLSRLRIGDSVFASAVTDAQGRALARSLSVNSFIGRNGIVTSVGPDDIAVRLRIDRLSPEFATAVTRILVDSAATIERFGPGGSRTTLSLEDVQPGQQVVLQGYIADDGALVALYLWPSP